MPFTIKELIEQLSHMPDDMPVRVTLAEPVVDININQWITEVYYDSSNDPSSVQLFISE